MPSTPSSSSRQGIRLALVLVALSIFGYLTMTFFLGAPDLLSRGNFTRASSPITFWVHFGVVGAVGLSIAYFCFDWKKGLQLIARIENRDRKNLESMGLLYTKQVYRNRRIQAGIFILAGLLIVFFSLTLLI